jgi:hypothetical protein
MFMDEIALPSIPGDWIDFVRRTSMISVLMTPLCEAVVNFIPQS